MIKKNLVWWGPVFSYSGYAQHNRGIIFELLKRDWNIRIIPTEKDIPTGLIGKEALLSMVNDTSIIPEDSICINLVPPPALPFWGKYSILYTTMESETVHPGFLARCNQYDELWVPCQANFYSLIKVIRNKMPLRIVPEGVDGKLWNPDAPRDTRYMSKAFTFFFQGDWSYRKGNDFMINAFSRAFVPSQNVRLLLFTHYQGNGPEVTYQRVGEEINYFKKQFAIQSMPQIEIIGEHHEDQEMPGIFQCADVGFFPTRGEAWMLPGIQLMALGKPIITSGWGGQLEYANNSNSYIIKQEKFDTIDDKVTCMVDFQKGQKLIFSDLDHCIKLLRSAFNDEGLRKKKAKICLDTIRNRWAWSNAGSIADKYLTGILQKGI